MRKRRSTRSRPLALAYVRVSTTGQVVEGASLDAQRTVLSNEAHRRGWDLELVADEGLSGKSVDKRPGLLSALDRLDAGDADILLVTRSDRLSRSSHDFHGVVERARKHNWLLVMLDPNVDMTTPAGELMAGMLANYAQFESRMISVRTREGLAQRRAEGVVLGRPVKLPAEVRERIVTARAEGRTLTGIADDLMRDEIPTARGGTIWYASTVAATLKSVEIKTSWPKPVLA